MIVISFYDAKHEGWTYTKNHKHR